MLNWFKNLWSKVTTLWYKLFPSKPVTGDPINFDAGSALVATPFSVSFMTEVYGDRTGTGIKEFPVTGLKEGEQCWIDGIIGGTISYNDLNQHCTGKELAICGWVGNGKDNFYGFDIQAVGGQPIFQTIPSADFKKPILLEKLKLEVYDDLNHPTDFRMALILRRAEVV